MAPQLFPFQHRTVLIQESVVRSDEDACTVHFVLCSFITRSEGPTSQLIGRETRVWQEIIPQKWMSGSHSDAKSIAMPLQTHGASQFSVCYRPWSQTGPSLHSPKRLLAPPSLSSPVKMRKASVMWASQKYAGVLHRVQACTRKEMFPLASPRNSQFVPSPVACFGLPI